MRSSFPFPPDQPGQFIQAVWGAHVAGEHVALVRNSTG